MAANYIIAQLKERFKDKKVFSSQELYDFYLQFNPELNENTFRWRIYQLKADQIISTVNKNEYTLSYRPHFKPGIDNKQKDIFTKVLKKFPEIKVCIWSTKCLNEFMLHQPFRYVTLLEVDHDVTEYVFHYLKELNFRNVFIQPKEKELDNYIYENNESIIIIPLITKSPLQKQNKINTPKLEKILVDIYSDALLFNTFQGAELTYIFNNAHEKYQINFTRLFNYAKRRAKENELMDFLTHKTNISKNTINFND